MSIIGKAKRNFACQETWSALNAFLHRAQEAETLVEEGLADKSNSQSSSALLLRQN